MPKVIKRGAFTRAEQDLNLTHNYFSVMKSSQKSKYQYMMTLGETTKEAYINYAEEQYELIHNLEEMYWWLAHRKLIFNFSKQLAVQGIFKNPLSFSNAGSNTIFRSNSMINHQAFIRYSKIYDYFLIYKETK